MKIAVVGNSADLRHRRDGAKVDNCDRIIRFNSFRLEGAAHHVGTRVDIVSICLAPAVVKHALPYSAHHIKCANEIWTPSWRGHAHQNEVVNAMRAVQRAVNDLVFSCDTGHDKLIKRLYRDFYGLAASRRGNKTIGHKNLKFLPTTGLLTLYLARARFPNATILITGFGLNSAPNLNRFDTSNMPMWLGHDIPTERQLLIRGLAKGSWERI